MNLFQYGKFTAASGRLLEWKIECDALTDDDWNAVAQITVPHLLPFGQVFGVPRGGLLLEKYMKPYCVPDNKLVLLVDDVWTTGGSMYRFAEEKNLDYGSWIGFVLFSRVDHLPNHVISLFTVNM